MERIQKLTELTDDLAQLDKQKRDVAVLHLSVLNLEKAMAETTEKLEAAKALLNASLDRIDSAFLMLYPAASPAAVASATVEIVKEQAASAPKAKGEAREKHPCDLCGDVFYDKEKLVKHRRVDHGVLLEAMEQPAQSVCWNSSCTWSDLAKDDHCDADAQFRAGRPVAECKCFVNGIKPTKGQNAAACLNTGCSANDPEVPNCCETWEEVWECPDVVTAGWGAVKGEESTPADDQLAQRDSIIKAAIAAGDDINEHGVYQTPEVITIPLPPRSGYKAVIGIATSADGQFCYGYDFQTKTGGSGGAPSVTGNFYPTRIAAIGAAIIHLKKAWPEAWTEAKLKAVRNAVAEFVKSIEAPTPENNQETLNATAAPEAETESPETEPASTEAPAAGSSAEQFFPLDEPHGDCELCMGYGVIEGELDGESTLVPCNCAAGIKVKGGTVPSPCDSCNIEDPDCASCHLPDMDAPFEVEAPPVKCVNRHCNSNQPDALDGCSLAPELGKPASECSSYIPDASPVDDTEEAADLPKCANASCTANVPNSKDICLRIGQLGRAPKDCMSFVSVESCSHPLLRRVRNEDGSVTCDLCGKIMRPAGSVDPGTGKTIPKESAEPTALQKKCPHPKPFRETVDGVETCKVCKMVLSGGGATGTLSS